MGDMLFITNIKDIRNVPTVQLPNNATMNATKMDILPLSRSLIAQEKKAHIFDVLHSALIM